VRHDHLPQRPQVEGLQTLVGRLGRDALGVELVAPGGQPEVLELEHLEVSIIVERVRRPRAEEDIPEFADVAGPGLTPQAPHRRCAGLEARAVEETPREQAQITDPRPKRRDLEDQGGESVEKVEAKRVLLDHGLEGSVRRADDAHADPARPITAQRLHLAGLQHSEERRLGRRGELSDLVEEKCAAVRPREMTVPGAGARERARDGPEKLRLDQIPGNGRAVHRHIRCGGAGRSVVARPRDELLADTGLSVDQHRRVERREARELAAKLAHAQAVPQNRGEGVGLHASSPRRSVFLPLIGRRHAVSRISLTFSRGQMTDVPKLAVSAFHAASRVNGPGCRVVLWVQGCTLGCAGCFNPSTHAPGLAPVPIAGLVARILAARTDAHHGLSFSGGEPFEQATALAQLVREVRAAWPDVHVLVFSGFTLETLRGPTAPAGAHDLLAETHVLVDGRFEGTRDAPTRALRASANQRLWVLRGRIPPADAWAAPKTSELTIGESGEVLLSGFPEPALLAAVRALAR